MKTNELEDYDHKFMPGAENRAIRYYFYLTKGLDVLNQSRNLFLGILALYIALHLDNWWLLIAMFIPSLLILTLVGFYATHRMNKVLEWLGIRFSSHYAVKQFNNVQTQVELLKEIRDKI